uniref:Bladder cancer-associated protein n=1 Tax=Schistosoma mansoni TaxID=6183 RepID=A0A146MGI0_SCHMA
MPGFLIGLSQVPLCLRQRLLMFCLQLIIPLLFLPKPSNPAADIYHAIYILLFLVCFFLERKPCGICAIILFIFIILPCYSSLDNLCIFTTCSKGRTLT